MFFVSIIKLMITNIQMNNYLEVMRFFTENSQTINASFLSRQRIEQMIFNILKYIELEINCNLFQYHISYITDSKTVILPFWPIRRILMVKDRDDKNIYYEFSNNKLEIQEKKTSIFRIQYETGYDISVVKSIPIQSIIDYIILNYSSEEIWKNNTYISDTLKKISNIYGKGDL